MKVGSNDRRGEPGPGKSGLPKLARVSSWFALIVVLRYLTLLFKCAIAYVRFGRGGVEDVLFHAVPFVAQTDNPFAPVPSTWLDLTRIETGVALVAALIYSVVKYIERRMSASAQ